MFVELINLCVFLPLILLSLTKEGFAEFEGIPAVHSLLCYRIKEIERLLLSGDRTGKTFGILENSGLVLYNLNSAGDMNYVRDFF